ncbi:577_t:CDS:2 [Diversispora eburnea]|uniref:577_t:CDS:1 n=1 Tax=Diversispora eburnea TaxID=1213867 RepID=A0A9N8W3F6_9GLOM|nr:577_t:CDS:2 [Diversispora eburnea]
MGFIQERVLELQRDLNFLYHKLSSNFLKETVYSFSQQKVTNEIDSIQIQQTNIQVIRNAIQSINIEKGKIPDLKVIICQLDKARESLHINSQEDDIETTLTGNEEFKTVVNLLEWIFLAKAMIVIYAKVMERLLVSTLPLSDNIYYWEKLHGSKFLTITHMIQTLPIRAYSISASIFNSFPEVYQNFHLGQQRQYFSRIYLFPSYMHRQILNQPTFSILSMAREEISYKNLKLRSILEFQAACLGLLNKKGLDFKRIIEEIEQIDNKQNVDFREIIGNQLIKCLILMKRILNVSTKFNVKIDNIPNVNDIIIDDSEYSQQSPPSLLDFYSHIRSIITTHLHQYDVQSSKIMSLYGPPSILTRWWIPLTISSILLFNSRTYLSKEYFLPRFQYAKMTVINFWSDWVWEPIKSMMNTIIHRERRLAIMSKDSLNSDFESLERMVVDFAREQNNTSEELESISNRVKDGDISIVLKLYEQELKAPFKSTIKVQKTKVDMELAMAALDKLLKANELNFAFLAVGPSLIIVYLFYEWIKTFWWGKQSWISRLQGSNSKIRESLRQVERLLIHNYNSPTAEMSFVAYGLMLCHVHRLQSFSSYVPSKNNLRNRFLEDLKDLDNPHMTVQQKLLICERIPKQYSFDLKLPPLRDLSPPNSNVYSTLLLLQPDFTSSQLATYIQPTFFQTQPPSNSLSSFIDQGSHVRAKSTLQVREAKCEECGKVYKGKNSRSILRRHLKDKHRVELPRGTRWDNDPNRPKNDEERRQRMLESKRKYVVSH